MVLKATPQIWEALRLQAVKMAVRSLARESRGLTSRQVGAMHTALGRRSSEISRESESELMVQHRQFSSESVTRQTAVPTLTRREVRRCKWIWDPIAVSQESERNRQGANAQQLTGAKVVCETAARKDVNWRGWSQNGEGVYEISANMFHQRSPADQDINTPKGNDARNMPYGSARGVLVITQSSTDTCGQAP
jgi:hypothetical protein